MKSVKVVDACWAVYFYHNQHYVIQCKDYHEANQFLTELIEKPATDPLGIYHYKRDEFFWRLRKGADPATTHEMHYPFILAEINALKLQYSTI